MPPSFKVCPTQIVHVILGSAQGRSLAQMRWGLVPSWWQKTIKDIKLAHVQCSRGDRDDQAIFSPSMKAQSVSPSGFGILRMANHREGKAALVLHSARWKYRHHRGAVG